MQLTTPICPHVSGCVLLFLDKRWHKQIGRQLNFFIQRWLSNKLRMLVERGVVCVPPRCDYSSSLSNSKQWCMIGTWCHVPTLTMRSAHGLDGRSHGGNPRPVERWVWRTQWYPLAKQWNSKPGGIPIASRSMAELVTSCKREEGNVTDNDNALSQRAFLTSHPFKTHFGSDVKPLRRSKHP